MADVTKDVTEPLSAIAEITQGLAAKNQTMKDGPPSSDANEDKGTRPPTTTEERQAAYDKYKNDISEIWDRNTDSNGNVIDPTNLALEVSQSVVDLAVSVGPEVVDMFSKLIPKK